MPNDVITAGPFFRVIAGIAESEIRTGVTVTFLHEVDLSEVEALRAELKESRPSYTAFVAKAVALALREFPYANRRMFRGPWPFSRRKLQQFDTCDFAVACERNVENAECAAFIDVMRHADRLPLKDITEWLKALASSNIDSNKQWRNMHNSVTQLPSWLTRFVVGLARYVPSLWSKWRGGAVLISSPAKYGVDAIVGTWASPLGISFGLVRDRAVVRDGVMVVCPTFTLTMNFDRRIMAGAQAGRFFARIVEILEKPRTTMRAFLPSSHTIFAVRQHCATSALAPISALGALGR